MLSCVLRSWPRVACQARAASSKASKQAEVMKNYNAENKLMFGELHESPIMRRKTRNAKPSVSTTNQENDAVNHEQLAAALQQTFIDPVSTSKKTKSTKAKKLKPELQKTEAVPEKVKAKPKEANSQKPASTKTATIIVPPPKILNYPMVNSLGENIKVETSLNLWHVPSVSKILSTTMSDGARAALDRWKSNLIGQLGEKGFYEHQKLLLLRGSQFHSVIHTHLSGRPAMPIPELEGCWSSLTNVLPDLGNVLNLESPVLHPSLQYRGIIDCIAEFRGEPMVIEWKKSDKRKPIIQYTYDAPLQMAAYVGAMNFDTSYPKKIKRGTVVVAYTDGTPADVFCLSFEECIPYWQFWLDRLNQYWDIQQQAQALGSSK